MMDAKRFRGKTTRHPSTIGRQSARRMLAVTMVIAGTVVGLSAATLRDRTIEGWDRYVQATEARIARELSAGDPFLAQDFGSDAEALRQTVLEGELVIEPMTTRDESGADIQVPDGAIHHWRGAIFVPNVTLDDVLRGVERPLRPGELPEDVIESRELARDDTSVQVYLKLRRKKFVTAHYNTVHVMEYTRHDVHRASSRSVATKIAELQDADTPRERELPVGEDRGFLWRMNSYWRYEEVDGGVIVECESMTLSRSIPMIVRWMVAPLIESTARESMERTLQSLSTRLDPNGSLPAN